MSLRCSYNIYIIHNSKYIKDDDRNIINTYNKNVVIFYSLW